MEEKYSLLNNLDKIHTTVPGAKRIINNLELSSDNPVEYCKSVIVKPNCHICKNGKNWYCRFNNIKITVNASSYTIITAHLIKK